MGFNEEIDVLRATIILAYEMGIEIASKGGSMIVVQPDAGADTPQFFAALAVRIEYAPTPEEAVRKMSDSLRELINARKKEIESPLQEAGQEIPRKG